MKMHDQVISPRAFSLGGFLLILVLLYASHACAAECPNHCSEDRIEAYAKTSHPANVMPASRELVAAIQSVGYVCDRGELLSYNDAVPGRIRFVMGCDGLTRIYTVDMTPIRFVVYPGSL